MFVTIHDEFIRLGQAMKLAGMAESGADAKEDIAGGRVKVNGEVETRRGRKLRNGDSFSLGDEEAVIVSGAVPGPVPGVSTRVRFPDSGK